MLFNLTDSIEILERTPDVLMVMLNNLPDDWILQNEGGETWTVFDIVGHLIECEKTNWMPRVEIILSDNPDKSFVPFDRLAQFEESKGKSLHNLLDEFNSIRKKSLDTLRSKKITEEQFQNKGIHPVFGEITLSHLIATWTVHDLNHLSQINRVMAKQYKEAVGPWAAYLGILK
jgi:DinB superfamily